MENKINKKKNPTTSFTSLEEKKTEREKDKKKER